MQLPAGCRCGPSASAHSARAHALTHAPSRASPPPRSHTRARARTHTHTHTHTRTHARTHASPRDGPGARARVAGGGRPVGELLPLRAPRVPASRARSWERGSEPGRRGPRARPRVSRAVAPTGARLSAPRTAPPLPPARRGATFVPPRQLRRRELLQPGPNAAKPVSGCRAKPSGSVLLAAKRSLARPCCRTVQAIPISSASACTARLATEERCPPPPLIRRESERANKTPTRRGSKTVNFS